jgi:hypothetical protein
LASLGDSSQGSESDYNLQTKSSFLKVFGNFRKTFRNFWKFILYLYQEGLHFEDWIGLLELLLLGERVVGMKCDDILGLSRPINTPRGGLMRDGCSNFAKRSVYRG